MAYDYNKYKSVYEGLNDDQRKQWDAKYWNTEQHKQFKADYEKETNNTPQQTSNESNFNNQNGTNWQNQTNFDTPTVNKTESQNNNQNNQTYNYDPNEKLDTSMFWASDGKVVVREWTAQQTWKPDYQLDSEARMQEITNNLNAYRQNNPEFFKDRSTFNTMFHYNDRDDSQKALLDTYWKKKQDIDKANLFTTGDSISNWMNDAEITPDQLNYIKEYSPEAYREWQQKQIDDINLRIANLATPADPTSNAELFNTLLQKLNLEPWDPYQIYDNWYNMAERLWVFSDSEKLKSYQTQLDQNHSKMESIMSRYAASTWGTVSDALAAARMQKALAPYQQREVDLQNSYTTLLNGRNSNLAVANQSAQALAMQAQEDQRIWNQRLQGLGFAMTTASYRSPEQQAQLQLQTAQIQNDMNLLQTSMQNDLNRYNAYATAKMQNQLQAELTDLSVEDEQQLKANLNNVLSDYYKNYGDIIQRSQPQVVDDIIAYAKKKGISVAQALTENFIKPLQNKPEYKQKVASDYQMLSKQSIGTINWRNVIMTTNPNWSISYQFIDDPENTVSETKPYDIIDSKYMTSAPVSYGYNTLGTFLLDKKTDWTQKGWQCWKFVNDYLESIWFGRYYDNELSTKLNSVNSDVPVEWAIAVFDYGHKSSDGINHGHVGIITKVNADWSFDVVDSNYNADKPETISKRTIYPWSPSYKWCFDMSKPPRATSTGSSLWSIDEAKKQNYLEEARRWQMTDTNVTKIWDIAAEQGWGEEWREALKQGKKWTLTDAQIKLMDKTDSQFSSSPIVKEFESAINQIEQLQVALNDASWVWDMSAIFTFMKTLDPSSVVRESEFNSAAATAWVVNPSAIWQNLERSYDWKFLTPQQRTDFKEIAKEFIKIKAKNYQTKYNDLLKRYNYYWLDTELAPTNMADVIIESISGWATWPTTDKEKYFEWYYTPANISTQDYENASFILG